MSNTDSVSSPDGGQDSAHPAQSETEHEVQSQPEASTSRSQSVPPDTAAQDPVASPPPNNWQAIFSPHHNAYYFFNAVTQETTWENPLQPSSSPVPPPNDDQTDADPSTSTTTSTSIPTYSALQQAALSQGIDPSLAYLDPSLLSGVDPTASASISGANATFTAKFNARTGTFTRADARDPSHLSEYERAKRMSEFYFDVGAWEKQREGEVIKAEEEGKKRKRPTKKDLERFKEQKRLKKIAKTAWLRQ